MSNPNGPRFGNSVEIRYAIPRSDALNDYEAVLREFAQNGYRLIYCIGFTYTDASQKIAKEFPLPLCIGRWLPDLKPTDNITVVTFKDHEESFLVGMIAGLKNDGGKIGFIGGMVDPVIQKFEMGFRAGALYVNSSLRQKDQILVQYISNDATGFDNPDRAYQIARDMYRQGATIVFHAAGGSGMGLFRAAKETQKWAIGVDSDQHIVLSGNPNREIKDQAQWILTSMLKRVNRPVLLLSRDFIRTGRIAERYQNYGLNYDAVGFSYNDANRNLISRNIIQRISDARVLISNNQLTIPSTRPELDEWLKTLK